MKLKVKRLTETARLPEKAFPTETGFDVFADESVTIYNGETVAVSTGIALEIPDGYYGRLKARSGLTLKTSLRIKEGTIDSSYRGEVKIIAEIKDYDQGVDRFGFVTSSKTDEYVIKKGMKIAQLIIQPVPQFEIVEADELSESDRGENGFGSTGLFMKSEDL